MFRAQFEPDVPVIAKRLRERLEAAVGGVNPDVVEFKEYKRFARRRRERFRPGELVNIVTSGDLNVCKACLTLAAGSPYTIEAARRQLPHHVGCRCFVVPLSAHYVPRPRFTRARVKQAIRQTVRHAVRRVGEAIRKGRITSKPPTAKAISRKLRRESKRYVATGTKLNRPRKRRR